MEDKREDIEDEKDEDYDFIPVEEDGEEPEVVEEDKRTLGEKIEDGMDDVVAGVQNFFYGERKGMNEDIPATMVDSQNEIRHINKVQTRRNFNKKYGKKFIKWMFIIIGVGLVVSLGYGLIEKLLMA